MKIVTDSGFDLSPHQQEGMDLHTVPLKITPERGHLSKRN